jgi:hypothetical protein
MSQESLGVPIVNLGFLYKTGLAVSYGSATTVSVALGQCRDSTNTFDIVIPSLGQTAPLTCSTTFVGANGLDTGTVAANTMYHLFALMDTTNLNHPALLLSKSATAPVLPSVNGVTYSAFRLIDHVLTDGSANILKFYNSPGYSSIFKQYDTPISVLSSGNQTAYTAVDLSGAVPLANFGRVKFQSTYVPNAAGQTAKVQATGATGDEYTINGIVASVAQTDLFDLLPLTSSSKPEVSYKVSVATSPAAFSLAVVGYEFSV